MTVGLTTTIPVEVIFAAGATPVDLNNLFINDRNPGELIARAERDGFPRNACAWIKGIYSVALASEIPVVVAVTQGDCAQTHAMIETLQDRGVRIIPFGYPYDRDRELLRLQMQRLMDHFSVSWEDAERVRRQLRPLREKVAEIDRLTWEDGLVTGFENHYYQVCCSDFGGNPEAFAREADKLLESARLRRPREGLVRIGVAGVPSASLVAIAIILAAVGLPVEAIGVLMVFDRVLDMCRTSVNVWGDACCATIVARLRGEKTKVDIGGG